MNKALRILMMGLASLSLASCSGGESQPFEVSYSITKEPTCTEKGREEGYDENGILIGRDIPALGHSYDSGTLVKEATCEEAGERRYACSRCQQTKSEEIPALGHSVSADYSNDENSHYKTCSRCNKHLEEGRHNFQFKSSTNLTPSYYFPDHYYFVDDTLKPKFACDENGKEIMGAINEYTCPTCNASLYKAEFITKYSCSSTSKSSSGETYDYVYEDYKIKSVSIDKGSDSNGQRFEYVWTEDSLTITLSTVSGDKSTITPFRKAIMTLDGDKTTKVANFSYSSSKNDWSEGDWCEFTYGEDGKTVKTKQSYLGDWWVETTWYVYDDRSEKPEFKYLKDTSYDENGNPAYTVEKTYDEEGKILTSSSTDHETGKTGTTTYTYTYDSQGRLLSNGHYRYEYYDGDSYRYYLNETLQKDVMINAEGILVKEIDYSDSDITTTYELLSYDYSSGQRISSSKTTHDYIEKYDQYDYSLSKYLKQIFSNGMVSQEYSKVDHAGANYPFDYWSDENTTDYSYTSRNFRAKVETSHKRTYENEDYGTSESVSVYEYSFQEFSISKNILPDAK